MTLHDPDVLAALQRSAPGVTPADIADVLGIIPPAWHADALCLEYLWLEWFPGRGEPDYEQRDVCARCLVAGECLTFAMGAEPALAGIWGGTSQRERRQLRKTLKAR